MTNRKLADIRPAIRQMPPYEPILPFDVRSKQLGIPVEAIIKLDANENPYGLLPEIQAALSKIEYPHVYPDPESRVLRNQLAKFYGVSEENILAGAGADELIDLIMRLFLSPGDKVLNCPPTFGMYQFDADVNAATVINVYRNRGFSLDMDAIFDAIRNDQPKLLFLASPNNPDGGLLPPSALEKLLDLPIYIILDEAYVEFAPPGSSWIKEVPRRNNLIVLRTFSKWAGLAGLRVGFGVFPAGLMPHLWKIKQPYNVSVAAATAAVAALENAASLKQVGAMIMAERERLYQALVSIPWLRPYPTQSNFILSRVVGRDAASIKQALAQRGILIRYFNKPGLSDHIRISVGKPEHTEKLLSILWSI